MGTLYELATGQSSRDGRAGAVTDTYVRKFKFVKSQPNESYSVPGVTGIGVGSPFPGDTSCTCVSVDDSPEGESRLVRNFTFTYKTVANTQGAQKQQQPPDVRPPNISFQFGVDYVATQSWLPNPIGLPNTVSMAVTPLAEPVTGLEKPQGTATIRVKQFVSYDPAGYSGEVGTLNSGNVHFGSFTAIRRTLLFKGFDAQPTVETFGNYTYSGWNCTYEFAYRENWQMINVTESNANTQVSVNIGWDKAVPLTSRNVKCDTSAGIGFIDPLAFPLEHNKAGSIKVVPGGPVFGLYSFASDPNGNGDLTGTIARAMTVIPATKGGFTQVPANEPIPINLDGSPRSRTLFPIVFRRGFHREIDFVNVLGLR